MPLETIDLSNRGEPLPVTAGALLILSGHTVCAGIAPPGERVRALQLIDVLLALAAEHGSLRTAGLRESLISGRCTGRALMEVKAALGAVPSARLLAAIRHAGFGAGTTTE